MNDRDHGGLLPALLGLLAWAGTAAAAEPLSGKALLRLDLRQLMAVQVTSPAKKAQPLRESAAAIHVITAEEIRRSGLTSIPELLRLVPGMNVAQIDGNKWAVSARGFNDRFANKLLVLVDGRSVYSPVYSGVYWEQQDTLLEDIERIEVIRGPGGTLWGANAVNGVVNIITKAAADTQGTRVTALAGSHDGEASLRHGGRLGERGHYRVYAKLFDRAPFDAAGGGEAFDGWEAERGGFRLDWEAPAGDRLTLQGEIYQGENDQRWVTSVWPATFPPSAPVLADTSRLDGAHLLGQWRRSRGDGSEWSLKGYFDRTEQRYLVLDQRVDTFDLEFQHRFPLSERQELTWGLGYRRQEDQLRGGFTVSFDPVERDTDLYSAFIQDEIRLHDDLRLTLGTKLEENDYSGFEYQPSARLMWLASERHSLWAAVSRAVHTPSRSHHDIRLNIASLPAFGPPPALPTLVSILSNPDYRSETLLAWELGWRAALRPDLTLDATAFLHDYDHLLTSERRPPALEALPAPAHLLSALSFGNLMEGDSYGAELELNWQATPDWRLTAGYGWVRAEMQLEAGSSSVDEERKAEGSMPEQRLTLLSRLDLGTNWELDAALYWTGELRAVNSPGSNLTTVDDYTRLDLRLGWRPRKGVELSLVGQNLLDSSHPEFTTPDVIAGEVPRSVYARLSWDF